MINSFVFSEILLYLAPFIAIFFLYYSDIFQLEELPYDFISREILLIPLWLSLVQNFSALIFGDSLLPFLFLIASFALFIDLYEYVRRIDIFSIRSYIPLAGRLVLIISSAFLLGLVILRIYTYFLL